MNEHHTDEVFEIGIEGSATGITDLTVKFLNLLNGNEGSPIALSQVGSTKIYSSSTSLSEAGTYIAIFESSTDAHIGTGDNAVKRAFVVKEISRTDLGGSGYDSANHSLVEIAGKVDTINTKVNAIQNEKTVNVFGI